MKTDRLICIVDDDASVRDSLSLMLGLKGYDCRTYAGGSDFLASPPSRPCCLVIDLKMGDMNGLELQERISAIHLPVQIIFLTAYAEVNVMRQAFLNEAIDFLEKPVVMDQLLLAIEKAFDKLREVQEGMALNSLQDLLTPREREVFSILSQGLSHREIGEQLGISPRTVEVHKGRIMEKLGARSMADLIKLSLKFNSKT